MTRSRTHAPAARTDTGPNARGGFATRAAGNARRSTAHTTPAARRRRAVGKQAAHDTAGLPLEVQEVQAIDGGELLEIGVDERTLWGDPARRR